MLHRTTALLLDETGSSVDWVTNEEIWLVVREDFNGCTVLEVARRWERIQDRDIVFVIDSGRIVEVIEAGELLSQAESKIEAL